MFEIDIDELVEKSYPTDEREEVCLSLNQYIRDVHMVMYVVYLLHD
jgi:hypothetical protein